MKKIGFALLAFVVIGSGLMAMNPDRVRQANGNRNEQEALNRALERSRADREKRINAQFARLLEVNGVEGANEMSDDMLREIRKYL